MVQQPQIWSRFSTKRLDETRANILVNLEGLGLLPAPVVCEHEPGLYMFMQRVLARQNAQITQHIAFPAKRNLGIYIGHDEVDAQFIESGDGRFAKGCGRYVFQRRTAP